MGIRDLLFVGLIVGGGSALVVSLYPPRLEGPRREAKRLRPASDDGFGETVARIDREFRRRWNNERLTPARPADALTVVRRLALALTGTIPSLEEVRRLEADPAGVRVMSYANGLLTDRRFADYFAERLARAFVGTEGGPFLVFRRRRFVSWLSDRLDENTPYDRIVRDLIASEGLWTDRPATNFLTVTYDPDKKMVDPERLAGRVSRAFLGARIDCAQCHDHPFAPWKQNDFRGIAAFFGQTRSGLTGLHEESGDFRPTDRKTNQPVVIDPRVPFSSELLPPAGQGTRRERLAQWVTHPGNKAFPRATVNRAWALMFGNPLVDPVDDLMTSEERSETVEILAKDFVAHGYDLRRLVRVIASTEAFQLDSATEMPSRSADEPEKAWAVFPMTRLRPEQVVGGIVQANSLTTIDANSPVVVRLMKYFGESAFVQRFGDSGEDEFDSRAGTIPQRLLMMNGELVRERTKAGLFSAGSRIGYFAPTDEAAVEVAYLTVLTRKPTAKETRHFAARLAGTKGETRGERMSDLFWTLVNATEFSWNH